MTTLKARVAANQKRLSGLKTVMKLNESIKADVEKLAALVADGAKKAADQRRKEDAHIKIVLGSGVMLLPASLQVQTIRAVMEHLSEKDHASLQKWCMKRGTNLATPSSAEPQHHASVSSPVGEAVVRVIQGLDRGIHEWLTSELLSRTTGKDRKVVEQLIAARL